MNPTTDQNPSQAILARLKEATNILVTVSANPSVDQLAACIGLTLALNKVGKHATAVFSGQVPSTIEFLQPGDTLEKNTDSLRDFIIALDKSKADKLRYKVEDAFVKIFITPYHTSLSEKDLEFSQGDFNVDVVVALGVKEREDLDQAITAHGRILHDATVISVNNQEQSELGSINWTDTVASSLSEMLVALSEGLGPTVMDGQIATAYLTGIVAETARFSNEKTSAQTMNLAARLMSAGANQQLVATKLEEEQTETSEEEAGESKDKPEEDFDDKTLDELAKEDKADEEPEPEATETPAETEETAEKEEEPAPEEETPEEPPEEEKPADGSLQIEHDGDKNSDDEGEEIVPIDIDKEGTLRKLEEEKAAAEAEESAAKAVTDDDEQKITPDTTEKLDDSSPAMMLKPPTFDSRLTANTEPEGLDPATDALTLPPVNGPLLTHDASSGSLPVPSPGTDDASTITAGGAATDSTDTPPLEPLSSPANDVPEPPAGLNDARSAVEEAVQSSPDTGSLDPVAALNASPMNLGLPGEGPSSNDPAAPMPPAPLSPPDNSSSMPLPGVPLQPVNPAEPSATPAPLSPEELANPATSSDANSATPPPPPVPPPLTPPFMSPPSVGGLPSTDQPNGQQPPIPL